MDRRRVVVLTSRRAPGLERLLEQSGAPGTPYRVAAVVASTPSAGAADGGREAGPGPGVVAREAGVPFLVHDVARFTAERGTVPTDRSVRPAYDRATRELLEAAGAELLVLCGYLLVVTEELLGAYPDRILNVHDSDLRLRDAGGGPRYPGLRATRDAVAAGEPETRSTVHLATAEVDAGPPLVVSRGFPVHPMVREARAWGATDLLDAYAYAQREWMMRAAWGELLDVAVTAVAEGRARRRGDRVALDGRLGPRVLGAPGAEEEASGGWSRSPLRAATGSERRGPARAAAEGRGAS